MEFLTELIGKMTISNLFEITPPTDFSYSYIVFGFIIGLVIFSFVYDFFTKKQMNKFLKKAMKGKMGHIRWTFPILGSFLLSMRLEGVPFLGMRILLVLYFLSLLVYAFFLFSGIKKAYLKKVETQKKYSEK